MKTKLLFGLFVLLTVCLQAQVTYSGVSVLSILTSGDIPPEITVSAGCVFENVSYDQALEMGLINVGLDSATGSISTIYRGYDPITSQAIVIIPDQTFTLPSEELNLLAIKSYLIRRYKVYANQIYARFLTVPKERGTFDLSSTRSLWVEQKTTKPNAVSFIKRDKPSGEKLNIYWNGEILARH